MTYLSPTPSLRAPRRVAFALCAALACASLPACGAPDPWERADPTEAARAFLVALAYADTSSAWEMLDDPTRAALTERADALRKLPGAIERAPAALLNPGHVPYSAAEIKAVEVADRSDTSASVRVSLHDGRAFSLSLQRADGRWRVSLPPPPPLSP